MTGTKPAVTLPMDLMPPTSTTMAMTVSTRPVVQVGTLKEFSRLAAIELPWVMLPMPKQAMVAAMAKKSARNLPKGP